MKDRQNAIKSLSKKDLAYYGAGDFGLNFFWQGASFLLLFFYTDIVGLPNIVAGLVYAIGGFVDAITDPAMGVIADRTRTKWGRYRPYLLYGAAPLGLAFALLFIAPLAAPVAFVIPVAITTHLFFRICYTIVSIPYGALGARLTFNARERTALAGARMLFGAMGGVVIIFAATNFRQVLPDDKAIIATSIFAGFTGVGLVLLAFLRTTERRIWDVAAAQTERYDARKAIQLLAVNRPFIILLIAMFLLTMANMIVVKTMIYRFEYVLLSPHAGGIAMTLMTATPIAAIPFWIWAYLKLDKQPSFLLGCAAVSVGLIILFFFGDHSVILSLFSYVIVAIGFSSFAVGFWSILPDTIDYGHWRTGQRIESGLIGFASAIQKIAIALSGIMIGVALDLFGYVAGASQTLDTSNALHTFSSLIPLILMTLSAAAFSQYPLTAQKHRKIVEEIEKFNKDLCH